MPPKPEYRRQEEYRRRNWAAYLVRHNAYRRRRRAEAKAEKASIAARKAGKRSFPRSVPKQK